LIGTVEQIETRQTHKQYQIDDGSGRVTVRIYTEMEESASGVGQAEYLDREIREHTYVKVRMLMLSTIMCYAFHVVC
jgi:hypothetical protein